jgi:predicted amidohydrolase YtcJ
MPRPLKLKIGIEKGKITSVNETDGDLELIIDGVSKTYPNSYVLPGLVDSHAHIFGLGIKLNGLNLDGLTSAQSCVERAVNFDKYRGDWIVGRGWNQELWHSKKYPNHKLLDEAFPNIPVFLVRVDGHAAWVNSTAMEIAGLNELTGDPRGGEIKRFKSGKPTGILIDNAMQLVRHFIPDYKFDVKKRFILEALNHCAEYGLTEIHDMDVLPNILDAFLDLNKNNQLPIRVTSYITGQTDEYIKANVKPLETEMLRVAGIKFYADGAIGSRGAAMLEPYTDSKLTGILFLKSIELKKKIRVALKKGFQIATHAIGDAANRLVLNSYQKLREEGFTPENALLRIEHAQIVHPNDVEKFAKFSVFAAVQPIHFLSDAKMMINRIGIRANYAYPWKSLVQQNAIIAGGSDFPIESQNPFLGIDGFINRIPFDEENSWFSEERISLDDALDAYTINAHKASNISHKRGTIEVGKDADLTIIDNDFKDKKQSSIVNTKVIATIVNGKVVYENLG